MVPSDPEHGVSTAPHRKIIHIDMDAFYASVEQRDNPTHDKPNVMVFVSHTPDIERKDLIATIAGLPISGGERLFMLGKKMQSQVCQAARKIDLFLWIDAGAGTCQHLTVADAKHRSSALQLFGLPDSQPT
ncbi:hypothetical protein [Bradyrhizobium sp. USDA 4529]